MHFHFQFQPEDTGQRVTKLLNLNGNREALSYGDSSSRSISMHTTSGVNQATMPEWTRCK